LGLFGSSYDLIQSNANLQPLLSTSSINGLDTLEFTYVQATQSNSRNIDTSPGFTLFGPASTNITSLNTFFVLKTIALTRSQGLRVHAGGSKGSTGYFNSHLPWSNGGFYLDINDNTGAYRSYTPGGTVSAGDIYIQNYVMDDNANKRAHYHNGTDVMNSTAATPQTMHFNAGAYSSLGANTNCLLGELMNYDVNISDTVREKTEGYLAHKWGIAGFLPANHPYKNTAPTKK
jgi:hypothetical protein